MKINELKEFVVHASAIRRVQRLQPIGGKGSYVSPPTYKGNNGETVHVFEKRRIDGVTTQCVLLDSVQSQANRFEEALLNASITGELGIPHVEVDFRDSFKDLGTISSLRTPHRIFDAIIRDSKLDGKDFPETEIGKKINDATPHNALALFQYSPNTLVFGGWNTSGDMGGKGQRFQRNIVSEIIGVNVPVRISINNVEVGEGKKSSSRIDPLGIERMDIYKSKHQKSKWLLTKFDSSDKAKPSDVLHGNIPPTTVDQGVTMDYAKQTTTLTLAGLRHLSFPTEDGKAKHERDVAAWTTLAAMALCAMTQCDKMGHSLRSRCDLYPENTSGFEIIHNNGNIEESELTSEDSKKLLEESVKIATEHGLSWETKPVRLVPQKKLVDIVTKSRSITPDSER